MERTVILPLSAVPAEALISYLGERGFSQSLVEWKYLNAAYNRGRERGICAMRDRQMVGFIGMIPVTLTKGMAAREDRWLCDWSIADPLNNKGLGGLIAENAFRSSGRMIAFGGTEAAKRRWRLKADSYDLEAGFVFRKHLTLGSFISGLQRRGFLPQQFGFSALRRISVARLKDAEGAVIYPGVHPSVTKLFVPGRHNWRPNYTLADLRWQLEDCPDVRAWTCLSKDEKAGLLFWRASHDLAVWKLVLLPGEKGKTGLAGCIGKALQHMRKHGGESTLAVVSRHDHDLIQVLESWGFRGPGTISPIFFLDTEPGKAPTTLEGLSFLDADDGHRF